MQPAPPKRSAPSDDVVDDNADSGENRARRRRAFSCVSCQRSKCRCDYDFSLESCVRCHSLKIKCSRKDPAPKLPEVAQLQEADAKFAALEDKYQRHEKMLEEMRGLLEHLRKQQQPEQQHLSNRHERLHSILRIPSEQPATKNQESSATPSLTARGDELLSGSSSSAAQAAPLMVVRDIGYRFPAPLRKNRKPVTVRLVDEDLLDEATAKHLLDLFFNSDYNHSVLLPEIKGLIWQDKYRDGVPFLESVCCLHAIADRSDVAQSPLHRRIFERVKTALGITLLDHSLSLDDIQGILMCTDSFRVGAGDGREFIDSWVLTGYCAKQAILCIDFDKILRETRQGQTSPAHVRAIRLWSNICLHHLHWTAASGRPSSILEQYINYCSVLLSFYDASVQDGILLAEVLLYSTLLSLLDKVPQLDDEGDCSQFASWRHEWRHLLALPTASLLKMGYTSACLILIVLGLEKHGEPLRPSAFLPRQAHNTVSTSSDKPAHASEPRQPRQDDPEVRSQIIHLRRSAAKHSQTLLQTFLGMPDTLQDSISSNRCLCLTYAALVLAHYSEAQSCLSDKDNVELVGRLHDWFSNKPSKAVLSRYTSLCKQIIVGRLEKSGRNRSSQPMATNTQSTRQGGRSVTPVLVADGRQPGAKNRNDASDFISSTSVREEVSTHSDPPLALPSTEDVGTAASPLLLPQDGVLSSFAPFQTGNDSVEIGSLMPSEDDVRAEFGVLDMLPNINIEDLFAGGYLDLH